MSTMTKRIFRATLLVGVAVLIASLALVMGVLYSYFGRVQESQLRDELSLAAVGVEKNGTDYLAEQQALATGEGESSRYSDTLLQKTVYYAKRLPDGTVLRLSAVRVTAGRSTVPVWHTVTVAFRASSSMAAGRPTTGERPMTTARFPAQSI